MDVRNRYHAILMLLMALLLSAGEVRAWNPRRYVNPNIGANHSRWFFYTPASMPFGMVKQGPSTNGTVGSPSGWEAVGYEDRHRSIEGFACVHEFQLGGILVMPTSGTLKTVPGSLDGQVPGYRSRFRKEHETAAPGYYSVLLDDYSVLAELTSTPRVAFQQYTFQRGGESHLIFDIGNLLGESGPVRDARVTIVDDRTIEGYLCTAPLYVQAYCPGADVRIWFRAVLDRAMDSGRTFRRGGEPTAEREITGPGACAVADFRLEPNERVLVKIGISYTSPEAARENLETEAGDLTFARALKRAERRWEKMLGRIVVRSDDEAAKTRFYTGLYHALLGRGLCSDVRGTYPKNDGSVGRIACDERGVPRHAHYNTDAVWGAYWNLSQLWAIAYPDYYADFINSQLLIYRDTGWLADGIVNSRFVSGVGTNMVSVIMAGAYQCGIRGFDVELAYEAALKNEFGFEDRPSGAGKLDVKPFLDNGYIPYTDPKGSDWKDRIDFSASHTLEYSFSAYAVAQWARALGRGEDAERLMRLADGWTWLFDDETGLMRPRYRDGRFIDDFDPLQTWRGFQEGNALQYTCFVPHAPEALVARIGRDRFCERLDSLFAESRKHVFGGGTEVDAFSGLESVYNHGNQPSLHTVWLFNHAGRPSLSQKWVRAICDEFYGNDATHGYGYGQDEDQGQLGAWYVMASLGLFDVAGLVNPNPEFTVGAPRFDKAVIRLHPEYHSGRRFVIRTRRNSAEDCYVSRASYDGKRLETLELPCKNVFSGGKLVVELNNTGCAYDR